MRLRPNEFPRIAELRQGIILATIAHAIWIAADAELAYELGWDGPNYLRQDGQGTRGTITLTEAGIVAAFRDDDSPRTPWRPGVEHSLDQLLNGMPENVRLIAEQHTLQYLMDEWEGLVRPVITAAFWSTGDHLTAAEPWQDVVTHGAHLIGTELMGAEDAIIAWQEGLELSSAQVHLLRSLYSRKLDSPDTPISLESWEYDILVSAGSKGLHESRDLLAVIGIDVPDKA